MAEPLRRPPRQERSERTLATILDAADQIFGEYGYASATTTLMAKRADISVGSIYRFFPDKNAIALALTDMYTDKRQAVYQAVALEVLAGGDDAIDRAVSTMFDGLAKLNKQHPGYFAVNGHLDPAIDEAEYTRQSNALITWFEMAPTDLSRTECEIIAEYTMVVTRALLDQTPAKPRAKRAAYLEEAKMVLITYLRARLLGPEGSA